MNLIINRGEKVSIPFVITDAANGLVGKRVTWSVSYIPNGPRVMRKESGLGTSTADITISTILAGQMNGLIHITVADFATLVEGAYHATLWIDDGANGERCVTPGGIDQLVIENTVARAA